MAVPGFDDLDTRWVTTYSYEGLDGVLVRVPTYPGGTWKDKRWHTKLFSFKKFNTSRDAVLAAIEYRDRWFREHAEESRLRPQGVKFAFKLPSNNTSGIVGVNRSSRQGKIGPTEINWQTTYPGHEGKNVNRKFPVSKYGEVGALRRAIEARRDGMLEYLATIDEEHVDANLDVVAFYDDLLANLRDYADFETSNPVIEIIRAPDIPATTKLDQLLVRVGQQRFRREVLEVFDNRCAVTRSPVLIRASHIKPWRVCTDEERLNPNNGLALSPVYDAAFDLGLISFSPDGRILIARRFVKDADLLGITGKEKLSVLLEGHQEFLNWHRVRLYARSDG